MSLMSALKVAHRISLQDAIAMTMRYRNNKDEILKPEYQNNNILPFCETFNKSAFEALITQDGAVAIRAYYGMDPQNSISLIFVAVDANGDDLLPTSDQNASIIDMGQHCPPICPTGKGPLN